MAKKILSFFCIIALLSTAIIGMYGCKQDPVKTYGDFYYKVLARNEKGEAVIPEKGKDPFIRILGLSEEGKQKEAVVVPQYIDDYPVTELGFDYGFGVVDGVWQSDMLKKVFIPFDVSALGYLYQRCPNIEKVILLVHSPKLYPIPGPKTDVYVTSFHHTSEHETNLFGDPNVSPSVYFSNVSFRYNYEGAPLDGYYWIDDYHYGTKITYIPEDPTREGYVFVGWYKEPECITPWNFDTDTLPEAKYNDAQEELYQETILYAKWIAA